MSGKPELKNNRDLSERGLLLGKALLAVNPEGDRFLYDKVTDTIPLVYLQELMACRDKQERQRQRKMAWTNLHGIAENFYAGISRIHLLYPEGSPVNKFPNYDRLRDRYHSIPSYNGLGIGALLPVLRREWNFEEILRRRSPMVVASEATIENKYQPEKDPLTSCGLTKSEIYLTALLLMIKKPKLKSGHTDKLQKIIDRLSQDEATRNNVNYLPMDRFVAKLVSLITQGASQNELPAANSLEDDAQKVVGLGQLVTSRPAVKELLHPCVRFGRLTPQQLDDLLEIK